MALLTTTPECIGHVSRALFMARLARDILQKKAR
jgi:hypothetical protein